MFGGAGSTVKCTRVKAKYREWQLRSSGQASIGHHVSLQFDVEAGDKERKEKRKRSEM